MWLIRTIFTHVSVRIFKICIYYNVCYNSYSTKLVIWSWSKFFLRLSRFEKTNEMLINFNLLSTARYDVTVKEFHQHTQLLYDMKKDLDGVFKRIRLNHDSILILIILAWIYTLHMSLSSPRNWTLAVTCGFMQRNNCQFTGKILPRLYLN